MSHELLVVTGASSGIGAAFVAAVPASYSTVVTASRRPAPGVWVEADLADPASWPTVQAAVDTALDAAISGAGLDHAVLFHCSGTPEPLAMLVDADPVEYAAAVILDFASGPVLGQGFLRACKQRGVRATLVMCSSPAAQLVLPRQAHYCASKAGTEKWAAVAAAEIDELADGSGDRVLTVVPGATMTPMARIAMAQDPGVFPLSKLFHELEARGGFATAEDTAAQVWTAVTEAPNGALVPVGA